MLDQSFYQKADEIIAFYGKKPASLIHHAGYPGGVQISPGRIAYICCGADRRNRSESVQCCHIL